MAHRSLCRQPPEVEAGCLNQARPVLAGGAQQWASLPRFFFRHLYKRVGEFIGLPEDEVSKVSGHSVRVGATQDLLALNIDLASVMQAGRWTTTAMPMRYGEHQVAAKNGMARAAKEQGRNEPGGHGQIEYRPIGERHDGDQPRNRKSGPLFIMIPQRRASSRTRSTGSRSRAWQYPPVFALTASDPSSS
jgi:hypothetical protein